MFSFSHMSTRGDELRWCWHRGGEPHLAGLATSQRRAPVNGAPLRTGRDHQVVRRPMGPLEGVAGMGHFMLLHAQASPVPSMVQATSHPSVLLIPPNTPHSFRSRRASRPGASVLPVSAEAVQCSRRRACGRWDAWQNAWSPARAACRTWLERSARPPGDGERGPKRIGALEQRVVWAAGFVCCGEGWSAFGTKVGVEGTPMTCESPRF